MPRPELRIRGTGDAVRGQEGELLAGRSSVWGRVGGRELRHKLPGIGAPPEFHDSSPLPYLKCSCRISAALCSAGLDFP